MSLFLERQFDQLRAESVSWQLSNDSDFPPPHNGLRIDHKSLITSD